MTEKYRYERLKAWQGVLFYLIVPVILTLVLGTFAFAIALLIFCLIVGFIVWLDRKRDREYEDWWLNQSWRKFYANAFRNGEKLNSIGDCNLLDTSQAGLLKIRQCLLEQIKGTENSRDNFVSDFGDVGHRVIWRNINANYSAIMAEYEDAQAYCSQELAHVQGKLNRTGTAETTRRGAPPPVDSSQARPYTTPPPDWSTVNTDNAQAYTDGLGFYGYSENQVKQILVAAGLPGIKKELRYVTTHQLMKRGLSQEQAEQYLDDNGLLPTLRALQGDTSTRPSLPPKLN